MNVASRRAARLLAWALLFSVLPACTPSEPAPSEPQLPPTDFVVSVTEWRFEPARLTANPSEEFTIELRNVGSVQHDWTVLTQPVTEESAIREQSRIVSVAANPGSVAQVTFQLPAPGEYQIVCSIPGHFSSGMIGTLVVTGA